MAVELIEIVNPNGRKGIVAATSDAAAAYRQPPSAAQPTTESEAEQPDQPSEHPGPLEMPPGNASRDDWAAYARSRGAADLDLMDSDGHPLGRDAIRARYGAPTDPASTTTDSSSSEDATSSQED